MENRPANPFRGLTPYRKEDREWLFGRDKDVILMQSRIYSGRTILLFAGSGVGKTSFLNAKIRPELEAQFDICYHNVWSGGIEPLEAVKNTISEGIKERYSKLRAEQMAAHAPAGEESNPLISELQIFNDPAKNGTRPNGFLLILDQFEEVFQYHAYEDYFKTFLRALCELINDRQQALRVIFSMREEFLGELSVFDNQIPDLFNNYYRLKYPDQQGAQSIISRTCQRAKVEIDGKNLVQLVKDLSKIEKVSTGAVKRSTDGGDAPAQLPSVRYVERDIVAPPYLQIACKKLWERQFSSANGDERAGAPFLSSYKPDDARLMLREFINEKLSTLDPEEQDLASRSFDFLVTKQGAKMAYELSQLAKHMGVDERKLEQTLKKLSAEEIRILRESGSTGNHWFELYHDMYGTIVDEWKDDYRRRRQLEQEEAQRRQQELREEQRRLQRKKMQRWLFVGALLFIGLVGYFIMNRWAAQREKAERAKVIARTFESVAKDFEAQEDRDEALIARLRALQAIKGIDDETEHRYRVEINRLISYDYPLLLATYREISASATSTAMFSADGQAVLTQGTDGTIRLWETETGKPINVPAEWTAPPPQKSPLSGKAETEDRDRGGAQQTPQTVGSNPILQEDIARQKENMESFNLQRTRIEEIMNTGKNPAERNKTEATTNARFEIRPTEASIKAVVKHPKYQFLIAGMEEKTKGYNQVFIWRADTGQLLGEPLSWTNVSKPAYFTVAFSPDGNFIAANAAAGTPTVWRIADDKLIPVANIKSSEQPTSVVFSPDSKHLLTTGLKTTLWDLSAGQLEWNSVEKVQIEGASFSTDGRKILTLYGNTVKIRDSATGKEIGPEILTLFVLSQATPRFAADNETVITEGWGDSLVFWDAKTGEQRDELFRIHANMGLYQIDAQAQTVLNVSDGVARLWKLDPRKIDNRFIRFNEDLNGAVLSLDGTKIITSDEEQTVQVLDAQSAQPAGPELKKATFSPDGSYLLYLNESELNNVHVWDAFTQQEIARFIYRPLDSVDGFDVSPDHQFLYVRFGLGSGKAIKHYFLILRINADKSCTLLQNPTPYDSDAKMVFSPDSKYLGALVKSKGARTLAVWELSLMARRITGGLDLSPAFSTYPAFSNDGKLIAVADGKNALIWEASTLHSLPVIGYSSNITAFKFSPDGKYLAIGYEDGRVSVRDVATAAQLNEFEHGKAIRQIEFNSTGDEIIVATDFWVHLLSLKKNGATIASYMHDGGWVAPFRFLNGQGSSKIRFLLNVEPSLLKVQEIDFAHPEEGLAIKDEPQDLLLSWSKRLNRKLPPGYQDAGF